MDNSESQVEEARSVFAGLELSDWHEDTMRIKGGGQATVLVLRHKGGDRGVFRYLRSTEAHDLARFFREVDILSQSQFQHSSIVRLLDYSKDGKTPWYISERSCPFYTQGRTDWDFLKDPTLASVEDGERSKLAAE